MRGSGIGDRGSAPNCDRLGGAAEAAARELAALLYREWRPAILAMLQALDTQFEQLALYFLWTPGGVVLSHLPDEVDRLVR